MDETNTYDPLRAHVPNNMDINTSGDGIPNRPQIEPPIINPEYQSVQIIHIVARGNISCIQLEKISPWTSHIRARTRKRGGSPRR